MIINCHSELVKKVHLPLSYGRVETDCFISVCYTLMMSIIVLRFISSSSCMRIQKYWQAKLVY